MDRMMPEQRSRTMSKIRSFGSKLEERAKCLLSAAGIRFVYQPGNPKGPDFFLPAFGTALFVDSCFWHLCPEHGRIPKSRQEYWEPKLKGNRARDARKTAELEAGGIKVVRIWEHEMGRLTPAALLGRLARKKTEGERKWERTQPI